MVYQKVHTEMGQWTARRATSGSRPADTAQGSASEPVAQARHVRVSKRMRPDRVDLRRRERREWAELIAARAEFLLPEDRALVEAVFVDGLDASSAAARVGGSARTVRRRAKAIAERVLSREFEVVMRERERWPRMRRLVATSCVMQGRTLRDAAAHLRVSLHVVRRQMDIVRELVEEGGSR